MVRQSLFRSSAIPIPRFSSVAFFYFPYGINIRFAVGCVRRGRNGSGVPGNGVICGVEPFFMDKNGEVRGNVNCKYYFIMMASAQ